MERKNIPSVCIDCPFVELDQYDYDGGLWANAFCTRGLFMPTRKNTCKVKDGAVEAARRHREMKSVRFESMVS